MGRAQNQPARHVLLVVLTVCTSQPVASSTALSNTKSMLLPKLYTTHGWPCWSKLSSGVHSHLPPSCGRHGGTSGDGGFAVHKRVHGDASSHAATMRHAHGSLCTEREFSAHVLSRAACRAVARSRQQWLYTMTPPTPACVHKHSAVLSHCHVLTSSGSGAPTRSNAVSAGHATMGSRRS